MPRRVRRAPPALVALGAAVALAGCGGGDSEGRAAVRAYISDANAVQREGAAGLDAANAVYAQLSRGRAPGPAALARVRDTADELRATRKRLAGLDAPAPAAELRRRLLAVFDGNIALADEAALLAAYIPAASRTMAALPRLGRGLRRGLAVADPATQERALATYGRRLAVLEREMRALSPPAVLLAAHRSQLLRLATARSLTARLRTAVAQSDAHALAGLLVRFRDVYASTGLDRRVQRTAVRSYRARLRSINTAVGALQREQERVEASLG